MDSVCAISPPKLNHLINSPTVALKFKSGYYIQKVELDWPDQRESMGRNNLLAFPIIYVWAITWTKLSILLLYLRIFTDKWARIVCWILVGILTINPIANTLPIIFLCSPREAIWDSNIPGAHCIDWKALFAFAGLINIITDVIMLIIPYPVIKRLQIGRHIKLGVAGTFLLGSLYFILARKSLIVLTNM